MSTYKITPLHLGSINRPKSNMIKGYKGEERYDYPLVAYYLEGEYKILVDTGGNDLDSEFGRKAMPYTRTAQQEPAGALRAIGVEPEEIEIVILTHLHWDHAANNDLFPNAKFYCQRKEYEFLLNPIPEMSMGYEFERVKKTSYELIDGDQKLFDGISVLLTPGHTVGMQSIIVDTEDGQVILTGDLITLQESVKAYDPPVSNGLFVDEKAMEESVKKVCAITKRVLPGHDMSVFSPGMGL